jgi:hypothetical protein
MTYAFEVVSNAMIYIPSFMKIGAGDENLLGGGDTRTSVHTHAHTHTHIKEISEDYFYFFK